MNRRGVALNTSFIKSNNMSAYYNSNQITFNNSLNVNGNVTISHNLNILGTDNVEHNTNTPEQTIEFTFQTITNNIINYKKNNSGPINELNNINIYIGNTYIFNQTNNSIPNEQIIISKKKFEYYRNGNPNRPRRNEYTNGITYSSNGSDYNSSDTSVRKYLKFIPTERGIYYLVTKNINQILKTVQINVLDNIYKYSSFVTNSGLGLSKNLNVGCNMNVKDGMFYVVNDLQYTKFKSVGVGTTKPRIGFDFTNLPNYTDSIALPTTIGLGTTYGIQGMIRYESQLEFLQGYIEDEWQNLGGLSDKDKDTWGTASIEHRNNELELYSNGYTRLTIIDDDFTSVGISTMYPRATLEINGNLNVTPFNNIHSGILFGNDTNDTDRYLNINLTNTNLNTSFKFKSGGGKNIDISTNSIKNMNNKNLTMTETTKNYTTTISGTDTITNTDADITNINSDSFNTITGNYNKLIEDNVKETNANTNKTTIINNSIETYKSNYNSNILGNFEYNINKEKTLYIKQDFTDSVLIHSNINIKNDLTENITGSINKTVINSNNESYEKDLRMRITGNKTYTIFNNSNTFINRSYDINVKGNLNETYLSKYNKTTSLNNIYNLHGYQLKNIKNQNNIYNNDLHLRYNSFFYQNINNNKTTYIDSNEIVTYNNKFTHIIDTNNTKTIGGNYQYNLTKAYYYNINNNKTINILENLNNTINKDTDVFLTGSAGNNIYYNNTYNSNLTLKMNKLSNLIVYNNFDKFIHNDVNEIYTKNKEKRILLSGHPYSGPNTVSFELENIDLFNTNYIKIIGKSEYNTDYSLSYVFPGGDDLNKKIQINDWFIFKPGQYANSWEIINSYYAAYYSGTANSANYAIAGPTDDNDYAVILWDTWVNTYSYKEENVPASEYQFKFILGPRKHQLEYNLTTHYIKIFAIGSQNTNISLLELDTNTIITEQIHPYISHVGTNDYRYNSNDGSGNGLYPNTNEFSRFIFIYLDNSEIKTNNIITKSIYYIFNDISLVYLKNNNNNLETTNVTDFNNAVDKTAWQWTIESVNPNDSSHNSDVYFIYNQNRYIKLNANLSSISLVQKGSNSGEGGDTSDLTQHFTFYYYNAHRTNINSASLTYPKNSIYSKSRISYLTQDYKKILVQNKAISKNLLNFGSVLSLLPTNIHKNEIVNPNDGSSFLFIYNNTVKIPGSGTEVGTFKIYDPLDEKYLFNEPNKNWIIESCGENNNEHSQALHIIKDYNNGNTIHLLYYNSTNQCLAYKNIEAIIEADSKFSFENVPFTTISGFFSSSIGLESNRSVSNNYDFNIHKNSNENYKHNFNITVDKSFFQSIHNLYNLNVIDNNIETYNKKHITSITSNVTETFSKNLINFIKQDTTETYQANSTIYIENDLIESVHDINGTGNFSKHIYGSNTLHIENDSNETYKNNFYTKSNSNSKIIQASSIKTINLNNDITIDKSVNIIHNSNYNLITHNNKTEFIGLDYNKNITQNLNSIINGNKNLTIPLSLISTITGNKESIIYNLHQHTIDKQTNLDYHKTHYTTILTDNIETLKEDNILSIDNDLTEHFQSNTTKYIKQDFTETISHSINSTITDDVTFNDSSDFSISCEKNINLTSNGYIHITNTNNGSHGQTEQRALVINGGFYNKKHTTIGADITINGNINVYGKDNSLLNTEDVDIDDPLIIIGANQNNDNNYSGFLSRCYVNSNKKYAGLVRNSSNTYAILNDINIDPNDSQEYSLTDMNTTYSSLPITKHSHLTLNKIISIDPSINSNGDLYISKNLFIGIVDTPPANANNSFTINISSNINTTQNSFHIKTDKNITYNITNSKDINITSDNHYNIDVMKNKNTHIHNNLLETYIGSKTNSIKDITLETYKKNYNINITDNLTKIYEKNNYKTIKHFYNINTLKTTAYNIKTDYNLNLSKNNNLKYHSNYQFYSTNFNYNINKDNTLYTENNHISYINGFNQYNINGSNTLLVKTNNTENYTKINSTIHNNFTNNILGLNNSTIKGNYDLHIINSNLAHTNNEIYDNNRLITIIGHLKETITGNRQINKHQILDQTFNNNSSSIFKKNNKITISNNLNSIITGNHNINIYNNSSNIFNKNYSTIITNSKIETYKSLYNINVYNNAIYNKKSQISSITSNSKKYIDNNYIETINNNSNNTIEENTSIINNNNSIHHILSNSIETFGNTYNITYNNTSNETYNNINNIRIQDNLISKNDTNYLQHTIGISTSSFYNDSSIKTHQKMNDSYYSNILSTIKQNNTLTIDKNLITHSISNKNKIINTNENVTNDKTKNILIHKDYTKTLKNNNQTLCEGNYSILLNLTSQLFIKADSTHLSKNNSNISINNDLIETIIGNLNITHINSSNVDDTKNSIENRTKYYNITKDNTDKIYKNKDTFIKFNLNSTCIGDVSVTHKNNSHIENHSNITQNIHKKFTHSIQETYNQNYTNNCNLTIYQNNNSIISGNLNLTIKDNLYETYHKSSYLSKGNSANNSIFTNLYENSLNTYVKDTYYQKIKNINQETYKAHSNITIGQNNDSLINGSYDINIIGISTSTFKSSSDITSSSNEIILNQKYTSYIDKTTEQISDASTIITNNNNTTYIGGKLSITNDHTSTPNINLTSLGGIYLTADNDINKHNNINFTTRTGIKNIMSYTPEIINTTTIGNSNITEFVNSTNHYNLFTNSHKTLYIIYINSHATLTSLNNNDKNIYIRLNLPNGIYNGQIIKIILHPEFEQTFDIDDRLSKGLKTNIVIRITDFCDTNDNEYVSVDLLLNRGGMGLSLIYIDNDTTDVQDGYWMFMNNSYTYSS